MDGRIDVFPLSIQPARSEGVPPASLRPRSQVAEPRGADAPGRSRGRARRLVAPAPRRSSTARRRGGRPSASPLRRNDAQQGRLPRGARAGARLWIWPRLRFNFRGVGASEGDYDEGRGEVEDLLAAWSAAEKRAGPGLLVAAGFSFGAAMTLLAVAARARAGARLPDALALAGVPLRLFPARGRPSPSRSRSPSSTASGISSPPRKTWGAGSRAAPGPPRSMSCAVRTTSWRGTSPRPLGS